MTKIFYVEDLSKLYDGFPAYAVMHTYEGVVSIWDSHEFAEELAEELEMTTR
jgi:hypothetical protein